MVITKAVPEDAAELLTYLKKAGGETDNLTFGAEGLPLTVEQEREYIESLQGSRDGVLFVARENGRIVGDASLQRQPRRMSHRGNLGICVLKDYWNQGVGSQLLEQIVAYAKENQYEIIDLEVRVDNVSAIHLYQKFGFKKLVTYRGFFKMQEEYVDFDFMYLDLK